MVKDQKNEVRTASWTALLREAITTPGLIHEAYTRFHRYSLRNQLLVMSQCIEREIAPGPLATFPQWEALGRHVRRGQKALVLCIPITPRAREPTDDDVVDAVPGEAPGRLFFTYRARWFVLSQTDGEPYEPVSVPAWNEERALISLGIKMAPFDHADGNVQGYATPDGAIAISPVAALPHKTLFHEVAHALLQHTKDARIPRALREVEAEGVALLCVEALDLPGAEFARGYLQHYLANNDLTNETSERIIKTANRILQAGEQDAGGSADEPRPP
jgi:antirestriction protein ArdC